MKWITSSTKPNIISKDEIWHPLLNIKYLNPIIPKTVDIAIFTSKHGVVDCQLNEKFAIGQNGIKNVADIKNAIKNIAGRQITYFRGRDVTDDLSFLSQNNDFSSIIVYEANFITEISPELLYLLQNNQIAEVEIKSKRSLESFNQIINKYNIFMLPQIKHIFSE